MGKWIRIINRDGIELPPEDKRVFVTDGKDIYIGILRKSEEQQQVGPNLEPDCQKPARYAYETTSVSFYLIHADDSDHNTIWYATHWMEIDIQLP